MTLYSGPTDTDLTHIPAVLKERCQWVLWRGEDRVDEQTGEIKGLNKIPIDPQTLRNADTTDLLTWGSFEQCAHALPVALEGWQEENPATSRGGGLGFVFTADDPFCGIDLDKCRNPDTGEIEPWAKEHVECLSSYTEVTPSSTGLHIIVAGSLPPHGRKKGEVEMYDQMRFFTMTGWHLPSTPLAIEPRQDALTALHLRIFGSKKTAQAPGYAPGALPLMDDATLLTRATAAKNGAKFSTLWAGDWRSYGSQSEADLALCSMLGFWSRGHAEQMDALFRQCGLMREKWDEHRGELTYGQRTIQEALARQTNYYKPRGKPAMMGGQQQSGTPPAPANTTMAAAIAGKAAADQPQSWGTPGQQIPPNIFLNTEMTRIVDETQAALLALPAAPIVYQRARHLAVIARGVKPPKWLHRPHDMPVIIEASAARLTELASQAAQFWKYDKRAKKGEEWSAALPPKWVIETLHSRTEWPFPVLEGIIASPTLRPDGSLLDAPGYDASTGLYLDTNGTIFPAIASKPGLDDARTAIGHLQEAVTDFPFTEDWHWSATLTAILSLVCRFAIQGNVPLFPIRANTRGSGKSLLADVISILGTGSAAPRWPQVKEDEEERKRLLTVALAGYPCLHIDNVTRPLGSPALDLALTSSTFSDRLLGVNEARTAPLHMVWLASGNNMQFHGDTARRIVPIDLDPKMERPEERTDFTHTPLLPWIHQERPRLTVAALTIVKAYFEAGCPAQGITAMGSFEPWSDLIRQALVWAGEADPNEGRKDLEAESTPEYEQLAELLQAWEVCYPIPQDKARSTAKTVKEVLADIAALKAMDKPPVTPGKPNTPNEYDALQDALGALDEHYDGKGLHSKCIGYKLRAMQGRMIGKRRMVIVDKDRNKTALWGLEAL